MRTMSHGLIEPVMTQQRPSLGWTFFRSVPFRSSLQFLAAVLAAARKRGNLTRASQRAWAASARSPDAKKRSFSAKPGALVGEVNVRRESDGPVARKRESHNIGVARSSALASPHPS